MPAVPPEKTTVGVQDFRCHDWRVGRAGAKSMAPPHGEFWASPKGGLLRCQVHARLLVMISCHIRGRHGDMSMAASHVFLK